MPLVTQIFNLLQSPIDVNDQQVTRTCFAGNSSALLKGSLFKIIKHFIKELTFNLISNSTMKKQLIDVNWDRFEVYIINQEHIEHKCVASLINVFENVFNGWDKPAHKPGQIKRWCGSSEGGGGGGGGREKKDVYGFVCLWLVDREFTLLLPDRRIIFNARRRIGEFNS